MSALTVTAAPSRRVSQPAPARPALRVVPRRSHRGRYLAAMVIVGAVSVFGIVSLSALAAEAAFAARTLESDIEVLAIRYDELAAEVAGLESPERVRTVATDELGMVRADQPAYLVSDRPLDAPLATSAVDLMVGEVSDPLKHAMTAGG
jgi:cell division protein FtsL